MTRREYRRWARRQRVRFAGRHDWAAYMATLATWRPAYDERVMIYGVDWAVDTDVHAHHRCRCWSATASLKMTREDADRLFSILEDDAS